MGSIQFPNPNSASHVLFLTVEKAALGKISVKPGDCEVCGRQLSYSNWSDCDPHFVPASAESPMDKEG